MNVGGYSIAKAKTWVLSIIQAGSGGKLKMIFVLSYAVILIYYKQMNFQTNVKKIQWKIIKLLKGDDPEKNYLWQLTCNIS